MDEASGHRRLRWAGKPYILILFCGFKARISCIRHRLGRRMLRAGGVALLAGELAADGQAADAGTFSSKEFVIGAIGINVQRRGKKAMRAIGRARRAQLPHPPPSLSLGYLRASAA